MIKKTHPRMQVTVVKLFKCIYLTGKFPREQTSVHIIPIQKPRKVAATLTSQLGTYDHYEAPNALL